MITTLLTLLTLLYLAAVVIAVAGCVVTIVNTLGVSHVIRQIINLPGVSAADKTAAIDSIEAAEQAAAKAFWYDITAPLVMLLVLPFVKRSADSLPRAFAKWDNNVSLNGDGAAVFRDDKWLDLRDGAQALPGEHVYTYDDPLYAGDAYYAKGHHPRSLWARYVWVGLRNRASQLSVDLGTDVTARPILISGSLDINRSDKPGHFLLKDGSSYHFKSIQPTRILGLRCAVIRSCGYKLEIALMRPPGAYGRVAAVAIGYSLKRWKD